MRQRVLTIQQRDFTGGLNVHDDAFQIAENETPDCLNVQLMPKGGFQARKPLVSFSDAEFSTGALRNIWAFYGSAAQIVVQTTNGWAYSNGSGSFVLALLGAGVSATTGLSRAATMSRASVGNSNRLYIQNNIERAACKFDGTTVSALTDATTGWNENIAAPAGGKMPKAKLVAAHNGYLFHGYTLEDTTAYPHRIRWSHPGEPEDYRELDYVDIGLDDGDHITALASYGSVLFIFKNRSVWALSGYDTDTFQLTKVYGDAGAVSQEAVVATQFGLFFFDTARGVFVFRDASRTPEWLWANLHPLIDDGQISRIGLGAVTVGWMDSTLFVSVPWGDTVKNTRTFVFDPQVGKRGAWYPYEFGTAEDPIDIGPMVQWHDAGTKPPLSLAVGRNGTQVFEFGASDPSGTDAYSTAGFVVGVSSVGGPQLLANDVSETPPFVSYFKTAWFAAGRPAVRKRWRRPSFVLDADTAGVIGVECFHDFTASDPKGVQQLSVGGSAAEQPLWGLAEWGDFVWGETPSGDQTIVRGTSLGNAYALQLRFTGPRSAWGLNAIDFRYLPRRVR